MATLTGQSIASSYEQLLHVDNDGGGNGTTHVSVKDGDNGTTFSFTIATDALMMTSTNRLEFGDTGTYINQSSDGVLNITSDTEVEINATTIDINGAVAMSGAITGGTNITISGELDAATLDISGNTDIDGTIDVAGASTFGSTITAGSLGADTDNTVVVVNSSGLLKTDEIDSRVWGSTLVDTDASGADNELATWSDANTIIGEGNLTFDGTDLLIAGGGKAAFRDNGGEYIYSVSDGTLGIAAGTEIDLTATNIDINGAVDISGNLVVGGNFTVNGTTTTINSTVMQVDDKMIELAHSPSGSEGDDAAVDGGGITLKSSDSDKTILWENDDNSWHFNQGLVIGIDDTGADVRVYSATTNEGLFYDSSEDEFGLLLTTKLKFHDIGGGEEIYASANGHLEINAGTTLDITAPTVDLNSATEFNIDTAAYDLNASGAVTIDGAVVSIDGTDDSNFKVTGSGKTIQIWAAGGGTQQVQLISAGTGSDAIELDAQEGGITFSLGGGAGDDFIVNSTTLVVESDNSRVGIGTASPNVTLDVSGGFGVSGAASLASSSGVTTIGSSNGLTVSAAGVLTVNSATDATNSTSGSTIIDGGVGIAKKLFVGTDLDVDGTANLDNTDIDGTFTQDAGNVVFNEDSGDYDFRVESDDNANMIFVDGGNDRVGIGTGSPGVPFHVYTSDGTIAKFERHTSTDGFTIVTVDGGDPQINFDQGGGVVWGVGLDDGDSDKFKISDGTINSGTARLTIDRSGNVSIGGDLDVDGTTNLDVVDIDGAVDMASTLQVDSDVSVDGIIEVARYFRHKGDTNTYIDFGTDSLTVVTGGSNAFAITSSQEAIAYGKLGIGTSSPTSNLNISEDGQPQVNIDSYDNTDGNQAYVNITKAAGTEASPGNVADDEAIGQLQWKGYHTDGYDIAAHIASAIDGTPGNGDMPGRLMFATTADEASSPTERMRIDSAGTVLIGNNLGSTNVTESTADMVIADSSEASLYFNDTGASSGARTGRFDFIDGAIKWQTMNDAGSSVTTTNLVLDANSRISLSNNDSGGTGGTDSTTGNTIFGYLAGAAIASGGVDNTLIGHNAGEAITVGDDNVAVGRLALATDDVGDYSVAVGAYALGLQNISSEGTTGNVGIGYGTGYRNVTGTNNTHVGYSAGTGGTGSNSNNTAIGSLANDAVTTGDNNSSLGYAALSSSTTGSENVAIGQSALNSLVSGAGNVALGRAASSSMGVAETGNIAIGYHSMLSMDEGSGGNVNYNIAIGYEALTGGDLNTASTDVTDCIAIGAQALNSTSTNAQVGTIAIGTSALTALTSGAENTAVGYQAGLVLTNEGANTIMGYQAGKALTGNGNVMMGVGAGIASVDVNNTVIIGYAANNSGNMTDAASGTVAIGYLAGYSLTSGAGNVAIGYQSLDAQTDGNNNTAIGYRTLSALNSGGTANVAIGKDAGLSVSGSSSDYNVLIGTQAGIGGAAAMSGCVAIGNEAMMSTAANAQTGTIAIGNETLTALTTGAGNVAVGYQSLKSVTVGDDNVAVGKQALYSMNTADGNDNNIAIGTSALYTAGGSTNVAMHNIAIGTNALKLNQTGDFNIGIGANAGTALTAAGKTIAIGEGALKGVATQDGTIAIGYEALNDLTSGGDNTAMGYLALTGLTTGVNNVAIGNYAADAMVGGESNNIAIGKHAMGLMDEDNETIDQNIAIGTDAMYGGDLAGTDRDYANNIAIGFQAMDGTVAIGGSENTFIGRSAGGGSWTGAASNYNVGIGNHSMDAAMNGAVYNTAVGYDSLGGQTTGYNNTALGYQAALGLTQASNNVIIGFQAGLLNATGSANVIIGNYAGDAGTDMDSCVLIGLNAGSAINNNLADNTTAIGRDALTALTSGTGNVAVGYQAADALTIGNYNTALGYTALSASVDGDYNTAIGYEALLSYEGADGEGKNTAVGHKAGKFVSTGIYNTFVGEEAGEGITGTPLTGNNNTALGQYAGKELEGAAQGNTFVGAAAGSTTEAGVENTCLGYATRAQDDTATNQVVIGNNLTGTKDNAVFIGNDSSHIENDFNADAAWNHSSDVRQKTDIKDESLGLSFIKDIRPVTYKHKSPSEFPQEWDAYDADDKEPMGGDKTIHGFIAQEVKEAMDKAGVDTFQGWSDGIDGRQRVSFEAFVMPLIKSVQELSAKVEELEAKLK